MKKRNVLINDDAVMNQLNRKMIERKLGSDNVCITEYTDP